MKIKYYQKYLVFTLVAGSLFLSAIAGAASPTRIAIFPFQIHAAEDLDYMQAGLYDMLASRLGSADGAVTVISREATAAQLSDDRSPSATDKVRVADTLQADYFVSGSLTALGAAISTDVQFYRVGESVPLVKLSQTGTQADVIAHIDRFAARVNQKVFQQAAAMPSPSGVETPVTQPDESIAGLSVVAPEGEKSGRWQSDTFRTHLKGVATGDVDGDGTQEIVFADRYRIYVYRYRADRFAEVARTELGRHASVLAIDAADINGNGKAEIFVTNFARLSEWPASAVMEYADGGLSILAKDTKWFYRVQKGLDDPPVLTAQKQLIELLGSDVFTVLDAETGQYVGVDAIQPPGLANIYDMAFTRGRQSGGRVFVGYDHNNEITAWSETGEVLWESGEPAGGSLNYVEYSDRQSLDKIRHYLSKRILLADTDKNGSPEFVAIKNINSSPKWLSKFRRYKRGYITCLEWDASGKLHPKWKTEEERGYISDVALGDVTHDGKVDLVFTVVSDVKQKLEESSSYVVIQQLP